MSSTQTNRDRRERLRRLAMETIDLAKDPYFMRNHLGSYECKLCLTLHSTEGNYLAHTQGKRHQTNIARRAARDARFTAPLLQGSSRRPSKPQQAPYARKLVRVGLPGYTVKKLSISQGLRQAGAKEQRGLIFTIRFNEISEGLQPRHRFMSAFEQHVEPPDRKYQYLLVAAEPYETIAFKVPNLPIDKREGRFTTQWSARTSTFRLQLFFVPMSVEVGRDACNIK